MFHPIHTNIDEAGRSLARQLAEGGPGSVVIEPGDLTRYEVHAVEGPNGLVVSLPDWGVSARLGLGHTTADYVEEKLRPYGAASWSIGPVTANVIADLLNATGDEYRRHREAVADR